MAVKFAGIDLLLEDPEGTVRAWLDEHLSEMYASIFCLDNTAVRESRYASIGNIATQISSASSVSSRSGFPLTDKSTVRRVGIPVGNYPRPPKPRINSLYWPTGAMRWAHGLFLISKANLDTVLAACAGEQSATFYLSSVRDSTTPTIPTSSSASSGAHSATTSEISASMFPLAPRPVSAPGVNANDRLWLLPLVDARYFWQFYHVEQYSPETWQSALSGIQGVSPTDTPALGEAVPSAYGKPSAVEFVRDFENAAVLTDAVGLSIGRRVVGSPQVSPYRFLPYKTQSAETAFAIADDNLGNGWDVVAGGEFTSEAATLGNTPTSVVVTYTETDGQRVSGYAEYLKPSGASNGGSKVFHCSATETQAAPSNGKYTSGFEKNLASQIGADFYRWNDLHYDITYAGIVPWEVTGFDDYVRWEVAVIGRGKRRKYVCQTRAVSMPPNFGFESLPIDPLGETSSSSGSSSSESSSSRSSSSSSSQSSQSVSSAASSPVSSGSSQASSGSSSSTQNCTCGITTYESDGTVWFIISSTCTPGAEMVRPGIDASSVIPGTLVQVCCRCPSSSSSGSSKSSAESSSVSSVSSSVSSASSESSGSSDNSSESSFASSATSSSSALACDCGTAKFISNGVEWVLLEQSCGVNAVPVIPTEDPTTVEAGTIVDTCCRCPSSSGASSSSVSSSSGSATSSGQSSVASSGTSSDASSGTSSGTSSGSSASSGCVQVVTDVQCTGGNLVVTKTNILATTC